MKHFHFQALLQKEGWSENVYVGVDKAGLITNISTEAPSEEVQRVKGYVLPAFQNAHSHAFQYAMAGLAENFKRGMKDNFWSWRETMYQIALTISPDDLEHIAAMVYSEMVRHGYSEVAEFHYLHHDKDGKPYSHIAEHGERLVAAAQKAGIKITLVPMFYQKGGFGQVPTDRQRRFISKTKEDYGRLLEATRSVTEKYNGASLGFGIHSLRAVEPEDVIKTYEEAPLNMPFHIHVSEQLKEIDDSLAYLGKRPVEWLLDNIQMDDRCHLVHATHLINAEVSRLARSKANVVLCPTTEGNLGDGIFRLKDYHHQGGKWSIGTDSHISLNPLEELRMLDYGQRLSSHERSTFLGDKTSSSSSYALSQFIFNGRKAMGRSSENYFEVGQPLDAVIYNADAPLLAASSSENILPTIIYSLDSSYTVNTIIQGQFASERAQVNRESIVKEFSKTIHRLTIR
ncbi:formimidoylglutamate deiminase [Fulvivirga sediminis]|uniref:Formimidoylglutamate deiminase n=1 Tax=Fulvivirga sediminis TaxID=2803949 RepID=A0A937F7F2_9BACT|nr:formimidoylglutamate deiminase [Fulvivirga sediminis]MBL3657827.1 formimidoylglutamate deiminase [Fulvivirga sediminis]